MRSFHDFIEMTGAAARSRCAVIAPKLSRALRTAPADLAAVLFPAVCHGCGALAVEGEWRPLLCGACGDGFPLHDAQLDVPWPLATGMALARFEGPARRLLIELKFNGLLRAGRALGDRMGRAGGAAAILVDADLIVPVPLYWRRRWRRGHNQAAVLARALGRAHRAAGGRAVVAAALRRSRATRPQVGSDRDDRMRNVAGAFRVRRSGAEVVAGKAIVLIDDVVTTGATAAAAARALLDAGAREVRLYAAAWAP